MDVGEYNTNTLLINNISSVAYRIYEPIAPVSSAYTFNASDVEDALRNKGHLVYMDAIRRGIWCFYLVDRAGERNTPEQQGLFSTIEVCGYRLGLVAEGSFEPAILLKNRMYGTNPINTPTSSSSNQSASDAIFRASQTSGIPSANLRSNGLDSEAKVGGASFAENKGYGSLPVKEAYEYFITAVLASLTTGFCHQVGAVPLNYRCVLLPLWMFPADEDQSEQSPHATAFGTFRVYLTTVGALIITLSITMTRGLVSMDMPSRLKCLPTGTRLFTAPLGAFGLFQGVKDGEGYAGESGVGQSPDTQISRSRPEASEKFSHWKHTCSKLIQMRGMSPRLLNGCSWLNIQFLQRKPHEQKVDGKMLGSSAVPTAPWPSVLCFRRSWNGCSTHRVPPTSSIDHLDPLGYAKVWFEENPEREDRLTKRKKEREIATPRDLVDSDGRANVTNPFSPMTFHRVGNPNATAAAGTMYPTPPDAVQPLGITPSFEGNISSPATAQNAASVLDMDVVMGGEVAAAEPYISAWNGAEPKREPQGPGFVEGENIYGDLGDDIFEDNELTDADFNFFDERPSSMDLDLSALQDMGSALDLAANINLATQSNSQRSVVIPDSKPMDPPVLPEFTKPELRHARSTRPDEVRERGKLVPRTNAYPSAGVKRQPSPFNPDTVYKRIRATETGRSSGSAITRKQPGRHGSIFEKVDFSPSLSLVTKKYQESGQYQCNLAPSIDDDSQRREDSDLLTTRKSARLERKHTAPKDLPSTFGALMAKINSEVQDATSRQSSVKQNHASPDTDDMSLISDQDDSSEATDEPTSPAKSTAFRRLLDDDMAPMVANLRDMDGSNANSPNYGGIDLSRLSTSDPAEPPIAKYFAESDPSPLQVSCPADDLVAIAQILTEQAATGCLRVDSVKPQASVELFEARREVSEAMRHSMRGLQAALPKSFREATECQLRSLLEIQDIPHPLPVTRVQPRPNGQEITRPSLFHLPSPHIELRRYDTNLAVSPSALSFWESLGLGPAQGSKDIISICAFPDRQGLRDDAVAFLNQIRSIYEALKLGTFESLPAVDNTADGLVACDFGRPSALSECSVPYYDLVRTESMMRLSEALAASDVVEKNFVVFFLYSPDRPSSIVEACAAFQGLYQKYRNNMMDKNQAITNDLVLQLVPLDDVAAETSLVVLSPADCTRLALETYDRCTLFGGQMPAPAIVLESGLPRMIDFKLQSRPSPDLLQENSCMHIAYAQSIDSRWITVAWTDNRGSKQMMASYCLGRRGKPVSTPIVDVFREIWDTTCDLVSVLRVHWRIIITKCGPMEQAEIESWEQIAKTESNASHSLTLMTVDTSPSLQLIPPAVKLPTMTQPMQYTTPVSTPQPFPVMSPEQSGNPTTPVSTTGGAAVTTPGGESAAAELDADASLINVTDTTWGAVSSHRLNNSLSLTELNPALASGYLIKRCSHRADEPLAALEVNVVYSESNPRLMDNLLKEMLVYFRGLSTVARMRGVVDREIDPRPWHIAAAEKGVRALYQLM